MKKGIHPDYHFINVVLNDGTSYRTRTTWGEPDAKLTLDIETDGSIAVIRGVPHYQGAPVMASDLRASAALVLAGLAARGQTVVSRVYHLDRGYERLEAKLGALGARITRRP